jgi:hypothetical protein
MRQARHRLAASASLLSALPQSLVLDEAHGLKNSASKRFAAVMAMRVSRPIIARRRSMTWFYRGHHVYIASHGRPVLPQARNRVLLTGTPVQNNVDELVSLLRFVVSDMFLALDGRRYKDSSLDDVTCECPNAPSDACCRRGCPYSLLPPSI